MKILIAEDDNNISMLLNHILIHQGYEVLSAEDGEEAWRLLNQHPDIRILITDLMMPVMDGIQLTQAVRRRADAAYIYIIMTTASAAEASIVSAVEAGVDEFLLKPVNLDELLLRVGASISLIELKNEHQKNQRDLQRAYKAMHQELTLAAQTQLAMLPNKGKIGNFNFDWFFSPSDYVAGDAFGYFPINYNYIGFYQADVAGHGVSSALLSMILHHQLTKNSLSNIPLALQPGKMLQKLNDDFQSPDVSQYFTLVYGCLRVDSGKVLLALAGHPCPIHTKRDGSCIAFEEIGGLPIGMFAQVEYDELELVLEPGDRLFIHSDGVTECSNKQGEMFSEQRLMAFLNEKQTLNLDALLWELEFTLLKWRDSSSFNDDTTLLAIERLEGTV